MTFLLITHVMYEHAGKTHLVQKVHVVRAENKDEAAIHIEAWLERAYPEPAYFEHGYDLHELPGVTMESDDATLEFPVSQTPGPVWPRKEET